MFVAKFSATSGAPFIADKNGNFPMIGEVLAGQATGSIINGTMFKREGLLPNKLYACENSIDPEYPENVQTTVIAEVGILEYRTLRAELGAGKITGANAPSSDDDDEKEESVIAPRAKSRKATV